eukprot:367232-Rhodomonas_salina.3
MAASSLAFISSSSLLRPRTCPHTSVIRPCICRSSSVDPGGSANCGTDAGPAPGPDPATDADDDDAVLPSLSGFSSRLLFTAHSQNSLNRIWPPPSLSISRNVWSGSSAIGHPSSRRLGAAASNSSMSTRRSCP